MPISYLEQSPAPALSGWVECLWCVESSDPVVRYPVPPDGCLDIVYSPGQGLRAVGTMTMEQSFRFDAGVHSVGIRFQPGRAGVFLSVSPAELTDRIAPLADLWGRQAGELERQLEDAPSAAASLEILRAAIRRPPRQPGSVHQAIAAMTQAHGAADLDWIARQANLSPRQFRRRCLEESGLTPKVLCRVLRFRRACRLAEQTARPDWPDIACQAGYFDQAHLIRDFRDFTGRTPVAVFSNTAAPQTR